jgi:hypothetical protein
VIVLFVNERKKHENFAILKRVLKVEDTHGHARGTLLPD